MDVGGAEGYGGGILDLEVESCWRRDDSVVCGGIGNGVTDDLSNLHTASLVKEQHCCCEGLQKCGG